ncbi:MAG TPA: MDR family MFS transporter [Candidatus Limnocylindria bacterium]
MSLAAAPLGSSAFHDLSRGRLVVTTAGVLLALLLVSLDQTIVGTALPRIISELNGLDYYAWVTTAYLVSSTVMVPIAGKLGDLFGRKPFILAGMIGFVGASALCGLSQDMLQLVLFRALQGLFAGILMANVFTVIADLFPPRTRARMQGLFAAIFGISSIFGPTVGGYLTDGLGWRWVFYVNLPVGIAAVTVIALGMPFLRTAATWRHIDFEGAVLLVAAVVPLLVALSISRDHDWTSPEMLVLLGVAAVALVGFVFMELREEQPIVPLALFRNVTFTVSVIVAFIAAVGMFGSIIFVPLLYQGVLGLTATSSGQLLTPMMFGLIGASVLTGQLITRIKRYRFVGTVGLSLMVVGMWLLAQVRPTSDNAEVVRDIALVGVGLGMTMPLYQNAVQSAVPRAVVGVATSQVQFWRSMGGTIGAAVLGSVLAHRLPGQISAQLAGLQLPPQIAGQLSGGSGSAQSLFDPDKLAATRAGLPPTLQPVFDRLLDAIRVALANTLHDLFLYAAAIVAVAIVASVFLKDVPLRGRERRAEGAEVGAPAASFGD